MQIMLHLKAIKVGRLLWHGIFIRSEEYYKSTCPPSRIIKGPSSLSLTHSGNEGLIDLRPIWQLPIALKNIRQLVLCLQPSPPRSSGSLRDRGGSSHADLGFNMDSISSHLNIHKALWCRWVANKAIDKSASEYNCWYPARSSRHLPTPFFWLKRTVKTYKRWLFKTKSTTVQTWPVRTFCHRQQVSAKAFSRSFFNPSLTFSKLNNNHKLDNNPTASSRR